MRCTGELDHIKERDQYSKAKDSDGMSHFRRYYIPDLGFVLVCKWDIRRQARKAGTLARLSTCFHLIEWRGLCDQRRADIDNSSSRKGGTNAGRYGRVYYYNDLDNLA